MCILLKDYDRPILTHIYSFIVIISNRHTNEFIQERNHTAVSFVAKVLCKERDETNINPDVKCRQHPSVDYRIIKYSHANIFISMPPGTIILK